MTTEDKERIEKDADALLLKYPADSALQEGRKKFYIAGATAEHEHKDQDAENVLVEMAATLNNLCRHYDQKNDNAMKFTMQKAYELSHKGIGHLRELDRLTEENADLREQLKQERNKAIDEVIAIVNESTHWTACVQKLRSLKH